MYIEYAKIGVVIVVALIASYCDIRWRLIPNWVTYPAIVLGLLLGSLQGWEGFLDSLGGTAVGGGLFFIIFKFRMISGGDVKLVGAMSTLLGLSQVMPMLFCSSVIGALLSILCLLVRTKSVPYGLAISIGTIVVKIL